jgi:hypothetical protein
MREITRKINVQDNAHDKGGLSLGFPGNPRHSRTMPLRQKQCRCDESGFPAQPGTGVQ